jgi:hypothetical protein
MNIQSLLASTPVAAQVPPEDLFVCYTIGTGTFSSDKKYFSVTGNIFLMTGETCGSWAAEHEILVSLSAVWQAPWPPPGPFNIPVPPVPDPAAQVYTKGAWTFSDSSSLTAVGQGLLHAAKYQNRDTDFWITANQLISNGTGIFEGAQGLKTAIISALIPSNTSLEKVEGSVTVKSIDVFRIARKGIVGPLPQLPSNGR